MTKRMLGTLAALMGLALPADAQIADFMGQHELETLPYEIPGTGRIGGVTIDAWGYLYVANQDERVWKIHPDGRVETFVEGLYGSASGVVVDDGELVHTAWAGSDIVRVERDGTKRLMTDEGLEGPVGIVRVGDALYTVNANSDWVAKVSMDGAVEEFVRDDRFQVPNGITADGDGNLYVVNLRNTLVLKITPAGEISEVAELPGTANAHVAYAQGALYVTQIWDHVVLRVGMDGSYQVVAGDGTRGDLPFPNGIAASRRQDAVYFNTLEGPMVNGEEGVIRVHRLRLPSPNRAFEKAYLEGGMDALRAKFDAGLKLREMQPAQIIPGYYQVASHLTMMGHAEAGVALVDWTAEVDQDEARATMQRGRTHMVYGDAGVAVESLERALELAPDNESLRRWLEGARAYRAAGR